MPRERDTLSGIGVACIGLAYRLLRAGARFLMDRGRGSGLAFTLDVTPSGPAFTLDVTL